MKTGSLDEAVAGLYAAFAGYPLRARIEACPCCRSPQETGHLHTKALNELTAQDLGMYTFRAMTTVGNVDDFRHFLPRIFELLTEDFPVDKEVILSKLTYADWAHWPTSERSAVKRFLSDLWESARHNAPDPDPYIPVDIGTWLCAIARAEPDLTDYLADWENDANPEAYNNLQRFLSDHSTELSAGELPQPHWEDARDQWEQVRQWARNIESRRSH